MRSGRAEITSMDDLRIILYYRDYTGRQRCLNEQLITKAYAGMSDPAIDPDDDETAYDLCRHMFKRERFAKFYEKGIWGKYQSAYFLQKYGTGGWSSWYIEIKERFSWFLKRTKWLSFFLSSIELPLNSFLLCVDFTISERHSPICIWFLCISKHLPIASLGGVCWVMSAFDLLNNRLDICDEGMFIMSADMIRK